MTDSEIRKQIENCDKQIRITILTMSTMIIALFAYGDYVDNSVSWFKIDDMDTYLSVTAEILSAILGLAIPLALNVVQMIQSRSKTTRLTKDFISEHVYKAQIVLLLFNITAAVLLSLFDWNWFWIPCIILFVASMIYLVRFILLIHEYVANLETYLASRYNQEIDKYFG